MLHKYHLHDQHQPWYNIHITVTHGTSQINIVSGLEAGRGESMHDETLNWEFYSSEYNKTSVVSIVTF